MMRAFDGRPDTEHKQAFLRICIVGSAVAWTVATGKFTGSATESQSAWTILIVSLVSLIFSVGIVLHIANFKPAINYVRRAVGMAHDVVIVTTMFYYAGEAAAIWIWVYPFTAIGNGFRFGVKWLLGSAAMGVFALTFLFTQTEYWASVPTISLGLGLNYIAVTIYTCLLLQRLRETTAKLEKLATHDSLTGLPNRVLLLERLGIAIESNRIAGRMIACVYFDIDGFKTVNDTWGHDTGDLLLQEVGRRTQGVIRDTDLLARLGGDEFAVILPAVRDRADVELVCRRIVNAIEGITALNQRPVRVSVSVGCVIVTEGLDHQSVSQESVVQHADQCMYTSKKSGSGKFTIAVHQAPIKQVAA